jgi:hypothetical protein
MAVSGQIYSFGDIVMVEQSLNAVAAIFKSGAYNSGSLIMLAMLIALLSAVFPVVSGGKVNYTSFLVVFLIYFGGIQPKMRLNIEDYYSGAVASVDNIPLIVGMPASITSSIGYELGNIIESTMTVPTTSKTFREGGFADPLKIIYSLRPDSIATGNPNWQKSFELYIRDCAKWSPNWDQQKAQETPSVTTYLLDGTALPVAGVTLYYDAANPNGITKTCQDAQKALNTEAGGTIITDARLGKIITKANAERPVSIVAGSAMNDLTTAYGSVTAGSPQNSQQFVVMMLALQPLANGVKCGDPTIGAYQECLQRAELFTAMEKARLDSAAGASIFAKTTVPMMNILLILYYLFSPILLVVAMMMPAKSIQILGGYIMFAISTQAWLPTAMIINFIINMQTTSAIAQVASGGVTVENVHEFYNVLATKIGLASELFASVPLISMALLSGSIYGLTQMAGKMGTQREGLNENNNDHEAAPPDPATPRTAIPGYAPPANMNPTHGGKDNYIDKAAGSAFKTQPIGEAITDTTSKATTTEATTEATTAEDNTTQAPPANKSGENTKTIDYGQRGVEAMRKGMTKDIILDQALSKAVDQGKLSDEQASAVRRRTEDYVNGAAARHASSATPAGRAAWALEALANDKNFGVQNTADFMSDHGIGDAAAAPEPVNTVTAASGPAVAKGGSSPLKTGLGEDVDKLESLSPSLQKDFAELKKDGWTFSYGKAGGGSTTMRDKKRITIDGAEKGHPAAAVQSLAHEVGHAINHDALDGTSKAAYVNSTLSDEGAATLENIKAEREIIANGGQDIHIAGNSANAASYNKAYDQLQKDGNVAKARQTIGDIFGKSEITSNTHEPYSTYYGKAYDKAHPAPAPTEPITSGSPSPKEKSHDNSAPPTYLQAELLAGGAPAAATTMADMNKNQKSKDPSWTAANSVVFAGARMIGHGGDYIFPQKEAFVHYYRNDIRAAATSANIPEFALAAVAFTEYGGDPHFFDDAGYAGRSLGLLKGDPRQTSFGDMSIQIRNAAPLIGESNGLVGDLKTISALRDPEQEFNIAAKFLGKIQASLYPNTATGDLTKDQISKILNTYNGPASKTYGPDAYKHEMQINRALNSD